MQAQQVNHNTPTPVLDAAIELLGAYQIQFAVKEICLNRTGNGDIEVCVVPASGGARVPYGRINKLTKRLTRTPNATA
jgi:hypothetical protein